MAIGVERAGFQHAACLDFAPSAVAVAQALGLPAEVVDVSRVQIRRIGDEGITLLCGGPPCQPFSGSGKRKGKQDERNGFPHFISVVDKLREIEAGPEWVITENVEGLTHHSAKAGCDRNGNKPDECSGCYWLSEVVPSFKKRFAVVDWRVLDAADFGIGQNRNRVFLVAGPRRITWPTPTHSAEALAWAKWGEGRVCTRGDLFTPSQEVGPAGGAYWEERGISPTGAPSQAEARLTRMLREGSPEATARLRQAPLPWRTVYDVLPRLLAWSTETSWSGDGQKNTPRDPHRPSTQPIASGNAMGGMVGWDEHGVLQPLAVEREDPSRGWEGDFSHRPSPALRAGRPGGGIEVRILSSQTSAKAGGREPCAHDVHAPAPVVRACEGTGLVATTQHPDAAGTPHPEYLWIRTEQVGAVAQSIHQSCPTVPTVGNQYVHTTNPGRREPNYRGDPKHPHAGAEPERMHRPCLPPTASDEKGHTCNAERNGRGMRASDTAYLAMGRRRLTPGENARLQDWPELGEWEKDGHSPLSAARTKGDAYRVVGNACPPKLAEVVARAVYAAITAKND